MCVSGKKWYVAYSYRIPDDLREQYKGKKWIRKKVYEDINVYKSFAYAKLLRDAVEQALENGYNPFKAKQGLIDDDRDNLSPHKKWTIQMAVLFFLTKWKDRGLSKNTMIKYERTAKEFVAWLRKIKLQHDQPDTIRTKHIEAYLDERKREGKWTNRGYNNELEFLNTIFIFLKKNDIIRINPCSDIRKQKTVATKHKFYEENILAKLIDTLKKHDPYLYFACQVVYYLCIRSEKELKLFRVGSIFPERKQVLVRGSDSKTSMDRYIPMPDEMLKVFKERKILEYPTDNYVFSAPHKNKFLPDGIPGTVPFGIGFFSKRFAKIRKKLGLSSNYTIFSMRHTRAVHLKMDGAADQDIMAIFGHTDFATTAKYLRDLGLTVNAESINQMTRKF